MIGLNSTARRRFRYNDTSAAERTNLTNKQRLYKQVLDEQVQDKRRRQQEERLSRDLEEKAWYVRPEQQQRLAVGLSRLKISNDSRSPRQDCDEERVGHSRFLTQPPQQNHRGDSPPSQDQEVSQYLHECQKILRSLRDITANKPLLLGVSRTPTHQKSSAPRRFIKFDMVRRHGSTSLKEMEERYEKQYGNSMQRIQLPQLPLNKSHVRQQPNRKERMAVIINPTPITHTYEKSTTKEIDGTDSPKGNTEFVESHEDTTDMNNIRTTIKMLEKGRDSHKLPQMEDQSSIIERINSRDNISKHGSDKVLASQAITHQQLDKPLKTFEMRPRNNSQSDYSRLAERSRKSQLEINKQRLKVLTHQIHNPQNDEEGPNGDSQDGSPQRPNRSIMTHLLRVKAHGYQLFQKVKRYKQNIIPMESAHQQ